ncbi:unnamed protein product [Mytilus coruscus]|uniref:BEN domain-containing protein n=1 Tax=Mytilus coruscus TaxID=42192 RepID=A0A6J8BKB4_MYTCO|nr:unnamed protein product [Mytilus coruscus]
MESMDYASTYSERMPQNSQSLGLRRSPRKHLSSPVSFTGNSTSQPYYQTGEECTSTQKLSATKDLNQYQEAPIQHSPQIQRSPFSRLHCPSPMNSPPQNSRQIQRSPFSRQHCPSLMNSPPQHVMQSHDSDQSDDNKLASSLLPLLFSVEELANSCGQGLKKKANDVRPPLDPVKIGVLKDYVTAWCTKNNRCMQDGQINDAVTEQVSYARKELRKL